MLTPDDLKAIEAREKEATFGEWPEDGKINRGIIFCCPTPQNGGLFDCSKNKKFISKAKTDVPLLTGSIREIGEKARRLLILSGICAMESFLQDLAALAPEEEVKK